MKTNLTRINSALYHYLNGKKLDGKNTNMSGNCSRLSGDCSGLSGDCSNLRGDLDDCDITQEDREKGINIEDLIKTL